VCSETSSLSPGEEKNEIDVVFGIENTHTLASFGSVNYETADDTSL